MTKRERSNKAPVPRHNKPRLTSPDHDFWVFGYGSLIWNPGFPHLEVRPGHLHGYHRHFCVSSHIYRGTPECPGLVLGLDWGGSCLGLLYRVPVGEGKAAMDYLNDREMITGVYTPRWLEVQCEPEAVTAISFVVDTGHEQYMGRLSQEHVLERILQGVGERGACLEYLRNTVHHLRALKLRDGPLEKLLKHAEARQG